VENTGGRRLGSLQRVRNGAVMYCSRKDRDKGNVNYLEESSTSEEEGEVCVSEWVDTPRNKPYHVHS
jgi:hypothetical protein